MKDSEYSVTKNTKVYFLAEKAMAPHSNTLAWRIPWKEERGRLQSMGSLGVGHNRSDLATAAVLFIRVNLGLPWWLSGRLHLPMQETQVPSLTLTQEESHLLRSN